MLAIPVGQLGQAVVNFCLLLVVAREVPPDDFARLSILWMVYLTMLNTQRLLVFEQVMVAQGRGRVGADQPRAIMQPAGWISAGLFTLIAPLLLMPVADRATMLAAATGTVLLVNDAGRYGAMVENRLGRLLWADGVMVVAAISGLATSLMNDGGQSWMPIAPFLISGIVSVVILAAWWLGRLGPLRGFVRSRSAFALWSSIQVLGINTAAQFVVLLTLPFVSTIEFAGLRAMQTLLNPVSTPIMVVQPAAMMALSRADLCSSTTARRLVAWAAVSGAGVICLGLSLAVTSSAWVSVLGEQYEITTNLVFPICVAVGMVYVGFPFGVISRIARLAKQSAISQLGAVMAGAVLMILLSSLWGVTGAAWAVLGQAVVGTVFAIRFVLRHLSATGSTEHLEERA
jgi:hypothetical protein